MFLLYQAKKVLISDYDGTFYINDNDIEKNKMAVDKFRKKGNIFVIATGRSFRDLQIKVNKYHFDYDYALINHGATIIDKNNRMLYNFPIKNEIINDLRHDLELDNVIEHFCCSKLESNVDFNYRDITKIALVYKKNVDAYKLNDKICKNYKNVNAYLVKKNMIEIISSDTNKSKSIKLLVNYLNLNYSDIYTIGDGYSDISMVKDYNGYAMKNSVDELKKIANKEYDSVADLIMEVIEKDEIV